MDEAQQLLAAKLNLETGRLAWPELERHFARGSVLLVDQDTDLIEVARAFAEDRDDQVQRWLSGNAVRKPLLSEVEPWHRQRAEFWAVVVAPFVLIQPLAGDG